MLDVSIREGEISSTCGEITIVEDIRIEMGKSNNGFCDWVTKNISET